MDNPQGQQDQQPQGTTPGIEALVDPKTGKLLGKYDDAKALGEGYWNAVTEMNNTKAQLTQAMQIIESLKGGGQPTNPSRPAYTERLETLGIPTEELGRFVEERASRIAESRMTEQLQPIFAGMQARQYMMSQYPDFAETEPAAMELLNKSPVLKARFESLLQRNMPTEAFELAYFYQKQFGGKPAENPEKNQQKVGAAFPQGSGSGNRPTGGPPSAPTKEQIDLAYQQMQDFKDPAALINLAFGNAPLTYTEHMQAMMRGNQ